MDTWYSAMIDMERRHKDFLHEADQRRLVRLVVTGAGRGRSAPAPMVRVVTWLRCRMGTLTWQLAERIRTLGPSTAMPRREVAGYRNSC